MDYTNPILFQDFSDPDVLVVKDTFYMIASSFNHTPGIPILKSKNLVNWKYVGYVFEEIPIKRFVDVCSGDGAWAPSLRYHDGKYYASIPFPDEGIYVSTCTNIEEGNWTKPVCLISKKGLEDPCPIWIEDRCYMVIAFAKSRAGFNSCLGIYEVSNDLKTCKSQNYTIIYDGHNMSPTIEGPKFYMRNGWIYIMAPAGSVKTGWQVCLRSKNIYGPYETKIVLMQNDSPINGPHQGALVELEDSTWAFLHFQDRGCYGRIVHLQPVNWINDWPICGRVGDELLAGTPVLKHEFLVNKKSNYKISTSDSFNKSVLDFMWQTPANKGKKWYKLENGLILFCYHHIEQANLALHHCPNLFLTKLAFPSFKVTALCEIHLKDDGDEVGFCYMGTTYFYICVRRINQKNHLQICSGAFNQIEDVILFDSIYQNNEIEFMMKFIYPGVYQLGFNHTFLKEKHQAYPGKWVGGKIGIFARGKQISSGYAKFKYFKVRSIKKDEGTR